MEGQGSTLFQ